MSSGKPGNTSSEYCNSFHAYRGRVNAIVLPGRTVAPAISVLKQQS